jgi:hypothetical protein
VPEGSHWYVNPGVPPPAVAVAVPSLPPKQLTRVVVTLILISVGCVMSGLLAVEIHPLTSVTVTVKVPAGKPVAVIAVPP